MVISQNHFICFVTDTAGVHKAKIYEQLRTWTSRILDASVAETKAVSGINWLLYSTNFITFIKAII